MALLVSDLQAVLSGLCGGMLASAGLDGSPASAAFLYPVARSLAELGVFPASPLTAADLDLTGVTPDMLPQLVDVAELHALESALSNYTVVDERISLGEQKHGQVRAGIEAAIARKAEEVRRRYGVGRGSLAGGTVDLDFALTFDDAGQEVP